MSKETVSIDILKSKVVEYRYDSKVPPLPKPRWKKHWEDFKPDGQLYGIGFIYDDDKDDRVLIAIDKVKHNSDIVALAEHKGELSIYTQMPTYIKGMCIGDDDVDELSDEWNIEEFVPYKGEWICVDEGFITNCVKAKLYGCFSNKEYLDAERYFSNLNKSIKYCEKYTPEQRVRFWKDKMKCQESEVKWRRNTLKYDRAEFRYVLRQHIKLSPRIAKTYDKLVVSSDASLVIIYVLSGCGMNYIGQTVDPYKRFVEHLCGDDCSLRLMY